MKFLSKTVFINQIFFKKQTRGINNKYEEMPWLRNGKMKSMDQIVWHLFDSLTEGQKQEFTLNVFKMQPLLLFDFFTLSKLGCEI